MRYSDERILFDGQIPELDTSLEALWCETTPLKSNTSQTTALGYHAVHDLVIRPIQPEMPNEDIRAVSERIRTMERHIEALRSCGMSVVSHRYELAVEATSQDSDLPVAYAAAYLVRGSFDLLTSNTILGRPDKSKVNYFTYQPLHRYVKWVDESGEDYVVIDSFPAHQHSYHLASGTVFMHDLDPILFPVSECGRATAFLPDVTDEYENFPT